MFPTLRAQVVSNPVTGEAYLFLDAPPNPPPPLTLAFTPDRAYVPSMPTPLSAMQDQLPAVLERAESTLRVLTEIIARIPDSLDRSDKFFTNIERIIRESDLPRLSADSRRFFETTSTQLASTSAQVAATSAQIERLTSELNATIGANGTIAQFIDETRGIIKAADLPATNQSARAAADGTTLAADDLRRSLPAIRDSLEQLRDLARLLQKTAGVRRVFGPRRRQKMTRVLRGVVGLLAVVAVCFAGPACLKRPETIPGRMLEPQLLEPEMPGRAQSATPSTGAAPIRLLDTQARAHIGRRLLRQEPSGELIEDPVWRWSSAPDKYLDTALRLELASNPALRLVDSAGAPTLATTLLVWDLVSASGTQLVGAVEFEFTGTDRVVRTHVVRGREPISTELPGDLPAASGRLLRRLALEGLTRVAGEETQQGTGNRE
jgi:hypothetical protein